MSEIADRPAPIRVKRGFRLLRSLPVGSTHARPAELVACATCWGPRRQLLSQSAGGIEVPREHSKKAGRGRDVLTAWVQDAARAIRSTAVGRARSAAEGGGWRAGGTCVVI